MEYLFSICCGCATKSVCVYSVVCDGRSATSRSHRYLRPMCVMPRLSERSKCSRNKTEIPICCKYNNNNDQNNQERKTLAYILFCFHLKFTNCVIYLFIKPFMISSFLTRTTYIYSLFAFCNVHTRAQHPMMHSTTATLQM